MLFGFFVALGGKSSVAHGGKLAGELKERCAYGLPQPFGAVRKLMQDTTEKQPRNPQNGRWFARDRRRRTPRRGETKRRRRAESANSIRAPPAPSQASRRLLEMATRWV